MTKHLYYLVLLACFCNIASAQKKAHLGVDAAEYKKLGIDPTSIAEWEDGMRTSGKRNTYEWWYFDMILKDKSKLVIGFYTKPVQDTKFSGIKPAIMIAHTDENGKALFHKKYKSPTKNYSFSKQKCDVQIDSSYCKGDLKHYEIHINMPDIQAHISLDSEVPSWRPGTGHIFFGNKDQDFFAWLPSVPKGKVHGTISYEKSTKIIEGSGYHDHNWGNRNLSDLLHHWYWSRAEIGDYAVIASQIYATKRYKFEAFPIFFVAKGDKIVAEDGTKMTFTAKNTVLNETKDKEISQDLTFDYHHQNHEYALHLAQKQYIEKISYADLLDGFRRSLLRLMHFNPTYYRMGGDVQLQIKNGAQSETLVGDGIWELFYLGNKD